MEKYVTTLTHHLPETHALWKSQFLEWSGTLPATFLHSLIDKIEAKIKSFRTVALMFGEVL